MNGLIALVGSGEYLPVMNDVDRHLLAHCGADGRAPRVVCLPTAAGPEGEESWGRWNQMGREHFGLLGAEVSALPVIDRDSANDAQHAAVIENADLIYFSGGNPIHLYQTMSGSKVWAAAQKARARGAVCAGCSAGAMILAEHIPNWRSLGSNPQKGFGVFPNSIIFPHFDRMIIWQKISLPILQTFLHENQYALGIDEETALIGRMGSEWQVMGRQKVYVITHQEVKSYSAGEKVSLPF